MITREQWDAMTEQQRWDQYCLLVSECGDSDEAIDEFNSPCGYMDCPLIGRTLSKRIVPEVRPKPFESDRS